MRDKVLYFGFGANCDVRMVSAVLGKPAEQLVGRPAILKGYALGVQSIDRIPDVVSPTAPLPVSPRKLIRDNWDEDFRSYVITPHPEGQVVGTIWELTPDERERIRDWELLDFGWQTDCTGTVMLEDDSEISAATERMGDGQEVDYLVDGMHYETWLHHPADFELVAERVHYLYDEHQRGAEGDSPRSDINNV